MDIKRPWLSVYGDRVPERIIEVSLTRFLEEAVEKYRDNTALTQGERSTAATSFGINAHEYRCRQWRMDGTWERINKAIRECLRVCLGRDPWPSED